MKASFEELKGRIGAYDVIGEALLVISGISAIVMLVMNIIFGYMSSLTTVCGTILIFSTIVGIICRIIAEEIADYAITTYPDEAKNSLNTK